MRKLLTAKDFSPNEEKCLEVVRKLRWKGKVFCLHCNSRAIVKAGKSKKKAQRYRCKNCGSWFTDLTKTIFEGSKLRLWEWFYLIKESQSRTLYSIAKDLEKPYWTVWRNAKKLRQDLLVKKLAVKLRGRVEMDESYITVGEKGSRSLKREARRRGGTKKRGRGGLKEGKIPIVVLTQRNGKTIFFAALEGLSKELILNLLNKHVEKGSKVNTDDFLIYTGIEENGYEHKVIPRYKGEKKFAEGDVHINNAENRFSFLKNWYRIFRGISRKYLDLWVNFFEFLINMKTNLIDRTLNLINVHVSY